MAKIMKGLLCVALIMLLVGAIGWIGTHVSLLAILNFLWDNIVGILIGMGLLLVFWLIGMAIVAIFPSGKMPKMPKSPKT